MYRDCELLCSARLNDRVEVFNEHSDILELTNPTLNTIIYLVLVETMNINMHELNVNNIILVTLHNMNLIL